MKRAYWLLVITAAMAAIATWLSVGDRFRAVIPGQVYRSAQLSGPEFSAAIGDHGLRTIINLRNPNEDAEWYREELAAAAAAGIDHHSVGMLQVAPAYDRVLDLYKLLQTAERPLLVHCRSGIDRSGLASAMALLMERENSLDDVAPQVSWRYGAYREDSAGKVFFQQYQAWLDRQGKTHSPEVFEGWLANDYVDPTGNVHFLVHAIGGKPWLKPFGRYEEGERFEVSRASGDRLELDGWAFDSYRRGALQGVEVFLDGQPLEQVEYNRPTDWLLHEFGNAAYTRVGWSASHPLSDLADGCHDLSFRFVRQDGSDWSSPPAGRICIS
jgi:protein tyrosine phosphatase (PTP) superfamily phosphohydrolase (DUF442 family)